MPVKKTKRRIDFRGPAPENGWARGSEKRPEPPRVSGRWLIFAAAGMIAAAALCTWGALCLLFWQGSWQLLYHPASAVRSTPASVGLIFDAVEFGAAEEGIPRLKGWWIPAAPGLSGTRPARGRLTVLLLHGQDGNLADTTGTLARLHAIGVNVLAFDYRGYGQSQPARPSETHWRQDAESALDYLTATRHIGASTIVLDGQNLGANLALEVAAAHPELAGAILESPLASPLDTIFADPRARLVPARLLVRDRYDLTASAKRVGIPVLWMQPPMHDEESRAFAQIAALKMMASVNDGGNASQRIAAVLALWLDDLPAR